MKTPFSQACQIDTPVKSDTRNGAGRSVLSRRSTLSSERGTKLLLTMVRTALPRLTLRKAQAAHQTLGGAARQCDVRTIHRLPDFVGTTDLQIGVPYRLNPGQSNGALGPGDQQGAVAAFGRRLAAA